MEEEKEKTGLEKTPSSFSVSKRNLRTTSGVFGKFLETKKNVGVTISVDNLCVSVDTRGIVQKFRDNLQGVEKFPKKEILHSISGIVVRPGKLLAILGTSGGGKSTLLNTLSGRLDDNMYISGDIFFNSEKPTKQYIHQTVGYVMQNDYLLPNVTETLRYAAMLRLPNSLPKEEKISIADRILTKLNLKECADTYIGGEGRRGVSGGEKRRVSIGVELLTNPGVLLLDEPTTGLDSFTANAIMQLLSELATEQRTVICTIHQPRSDIFKMFDLVLLLSKGNAVYFGPAKEMVNYFSKLSYDCPTLMNPSDFYMDLITVDNRTPEAETRTSETLNKLVEAYNQNVKENERTSLKLSSEENPYFGGASFLFQTAILTERSFKNIIRDRMSFLARFIEVILMGIAMGIIFYQLEENTLAGITSRFAFLYNMNIMQPYLLMIITLLHYSRELLIYDRERYDGMVKPIPYFLAVKITNLPLDIVTSIIFGTITYWMAGVRNSAENFFWYLLITFLVQYSIVSLSFMTSAFVRTFAVSSLIVNLISAWWSYSSGFLLNPDRYPIYLTIIQYTSPFSWSLGALSANEFKDNRYTCPSPGSPECALYDGNTFLDSLKLYSPNISPNIGIVAAIAFIFDIVTLLALNFVKYKPK